MSDVTSVTGARDRRWLILGVIGLAQLIVVLDLTVMNIALPSAQRALGFTTVDRQWVVTAYTLAFGSLLLLGGRLADLLGRKVTFLAGLVGFAGVSAIGGASVNFAMLPRRPDPAYSVVGAPPYHHGLPEVVLDDALPEVVLGQ
jgi:MFS family permease